MRRRKDYRKIPAAFTLQQFRALDDAAFSEGISIAQLLRRIVADRFNVPRETVSKTLQDSFLDSNQRGC